MTKKHHEPEHREFEVRYWFSYPQAKRPSTRGYPKTERGVLKKSYGAAGALRLITSGWCSKVQCVHRPTQTVVWTAIREKVPGLKIFQARLIKGDYYTQRPNETPQIITQGAPS